jgi:hypothetical protein
MGWFILFRLELALADLRAKSSDRILRVIAVRSFLALINHAQKLSTAILAQHENAPCQHNANPFNLPN